MRIVVAPERDLWVDVGTVDANGEVQRRSPVVDTGRADDRPASDPVTGSHPRRRQVGVGGLDPTVVDGHGAIPDDDSRE